MGTACEDAVVAGVVDAVVAGVVMITFTLLWYRCWIFQD